MLDEDIAKTKNIITKQLDANAVYMDDNMFERHSKGYYWSTENIRGFCNCLDFSQISKILSVLASGDQAFNFIVNGVKDIDTFDSNNLTQYNALGLKRAMIMKYNRDQFLQTNHSLTSEKASPNTICEIISDLLPYMDKEYRYYWKEIISFYNNALKYYPCKLNLMKMLYIYYPYFGALIARNNYLHSKKEYDILRQNIGKANITFKCCDALNLDREFNETYDLIHLSNIPDYFDFLKDQKWGIEELNKYRDRLFKLLNTNGSLVIHYIFSYIMDGDIKNPIINDSIVKLSDLKEYEIHKVEKITHIHDYMPFLHFSDYDGIILARKK